LIDFKWHRKLTFTGAFLFIFLRRKRPPAKKNKVSANNISSTSSKMFNQYRKCGPNVIEIENNSQKWWWCCVPENQTTQEIKLRWLEPDEGETPRLQPKY
jgi:hypothetical protein